jgi:hypothetical protein
MDWTWAGAVLSAFFAAISGVAALMQARMQQRGLKLQDHDGRVTVLLELMKRWDETLKPLYAMREQAAAFKASPGQFETVPQFMNSDYWKTMRQVCNFYEFAGLLVYNKVLRAETLLVIITVRGDDYEIARPAIDRLRLQYRPDIYLLWDWLVHTCAGEDERAVKAKHDEIDAVRERFLKYKAEEGVTVNTHALTSLNPFDPKEKPGL